MVPSAVALFSSAVPCQRALLAYPARSGRMTVITNRPSASKEAMPAGFAPYCCNLVPSPLFCSHETTFHVPTSCSFSDDGSAVFKLPHSICQPEGRTTHHLCRFTLANDRSWRKADERRWPPCSSMDHAVWVPRRSPGRGMIYFILLNRTLLPSASRVA